ncbi:MAG: BrnT family toxin [Tolypothrix brevis GSE-NOS-MK-07-07A]|jgi:hypothetical protein|nr:BrnT family toxin [Tolypothrix brevis GSE-NOS-MK-07-07A]
MNDADNFEWDDQKALVNYAKHGVSFEEASEVFNDLFGIEKQDDREAYGEERFIRIGIAGNKLLMVVYTERGEKTRIISAREVTKNERNDYYRENAQGWDGS